MIKHTTTSLANAAVNYAKENFEHGDDWQDRLDDLIDRACTKYKATDQERDEVLIIVNKRLFHSVL